MDATRKRRWFQFSLRTLFIVVTLAAIPLGWLGWQASAVRERTRRANAAAAIVPSTAGNRDEISTVRRWMGDKQYLLIGLDNHEPDSKLEDYRAMFPEANIVRMSDFSDAYDNLVRAGKARWLPTPF